MLIRIVRMTFRPDALGTFMEIFDRSAPLILGVDGCRHLELWQDDRYPNIVSTYSLWSGPDALERYRRSELFRETWARTRPLFAAPPEAHSHTVLRRPNRGPQLA